MTAVPPPSRAPWAWAGVIALLALYWGLAVTAAPRLGITGDEPVHLVGGYSYWRFNDYRMQPENGTLAMRIAALPLLTMDLKWVPLDDPAWQHSLANTVGYQFLFGLGNPYTRMVIAARAMIALIGVMTLWLIWRWAARLFGPAGGWTALVLAVFSPTLLAHGSLATSDMAITCCLLLAVSAFWRLLHQVTWLRLIAASGAVGAALLAKMSGVLVFPMLALLVGVRLLRRAPLVVALTSRAQWRRGRGGVLVTGALLWTAVVGAGLGIVWAGYGFRYSAFAPGLAKNAQFYFSWPQILDEEQLPGGSAADLSSRLSLPARAPAPTLMTHAIGWANAHHLLPEAYLWGFAHTYKFSRQRSAFLDGDYSRTGWKRFFPLSFWYKTTLPTMLLLVCGVAAVFCSRGRHFGRDRILYRAAPLIVLFTLYWAVALQTKLNIGHRHILPTYPVVFVFAGAAALWLGRLRLRLVGGALVLALTAQAADSMLVRPFYLSYFQPLAGGPNQGWHHLVDSSYDWGQGLPALEAWLQRTQATRGSEPVYLTYFGADSPRDRHLPAIRFADETNDVGPRQYPIRPHGGWFAISATHLRRVYLRMAGPWDERREALYQELRTTLSDSTRSRAQFANSEELLTATMDFEVLEFGRLCAYLDDREPVTIVGGSILMYHLTDRDVAFALTAPLQELRRASNRKTP